MIRVKSKFFNTSLRRWTAFPASECADRFRFSTYEELTKRDKLNLDIFWLKDESLEDSANLAGFSSMPGFPRHTQKLGASRRKAGSRYLRAVSARSRHYRR